jgi:hypothetical protein
MSTFGLPNTFNVVLPTSQPAENDNCLQSTPNENVAKKPLRGNAIRLPGCGLPFDNLITDIGRGVPVIPHPITNGVESEPITVRELRMLEFINQVTDKPDWERKVFEKPIIEKWKEEAKQEVMISGARDVALSPDMFQYVSSPIL